MLPSVPATCSHEHTIIRGCHYLQQWAAINRSQNLIDHLGFETMGRSSKVTVNPVVRDSSLSGCFVVGDGSQLLKEVSTTMVIGVQYKSFLLILDVTLWFAGGGEAREERRKKRKKIQMVI